MTSVTVADLDQKYHNGTIFKHGSQDELCQSRPDPLFMICFRWSIQDWHFFVAPSGSSRICNELDVMVIEMIPSARR
ncbi:hypothetical protein SeLEV6574_g03857 [Synchytrium endobioticum]|uniref:Uncharacterized protein n=1 Tax=Synchytrium endobioticum TaxID=286115 RepID=A0A507D288_9FUNG|nr:hypothetical protein SeLEV6574_g03857 [Synchytrium endobioticum]